MISLAFPEKFKIHQFNIFATLKDSKTYIGFRQNIEFVNAFFCNPYVKRSFGYISRKEMISSKQLEYTAFEWRGAFCETLILLKVLEHSILNILV